MLIDRIWFATLPLLPTRLAGASVTRLWARTHANFAVTASERSRLCVEFVRVRAPGVSHALVRSRTPRAVAPGVRSPWGRTGRCCAPLPRRLVLTAPERSEAGEGA